MGARLRREFVVVELFIVLAHAVRKDREVLARKVQGMAVGEMASVGEVHAENRVARLQHGQVHRHVGLGA